MAIASAPASRRRGGRAPGRGGAAEQLAASGQGALGRGGVEERPSEEDVAVLAEMAAARPARRHEQGFLAFDSMPGTSGNPKSNGWHLTDSWLSAILLKNLGLGSYSVPDGGESIRHKEKHNACVVERSRRSHGQIAFMPCIRGEDHSSRNIQNTCCFLVATACQKR